MHVDCKILEGVQKLFWTRFGPELQYKIVLQLRHLNSARKPSHQGLEQSSEEFAFHCTILMLIILLPHVHESPIVFLAYSIPLASERECIFQINQSCSDFHSSSSGSSKGNKSCLQTLRTSMNLCLWKWHSVHRVWWCLFFPKVKLGGMLSLTEIYYKHPTQNKIAMVNWGSVQISKGHTQNLKPITACTELTLWS